MDLEVDSGQLTVACNCQMNCGDKECCGTSCLDLQNDAKNCGACGQTCGTRQVCAAGACGCAAGTTTCGASCADTTSDPRNCGACGRACGGSQVCAMGACRPTPPRQICPMTPPCVTGTRPARSSALSFASTFAWPRSTAMKAPASKRTLICYAGASAAAVSRDPHGRRWLGPAATASRRPGPPA